MKQVNLLEKTQQERVKIEIIVSNIRAMLSLVVLIASLIAILFSVANMILKSEIITSLVNSTFIQSKNNRLNNELADLSNLLTKSDTVQNKFWPARQSIIEISQLTAPGNIISSLSINIEAKTAVITGFALKRDDLLAFQENLEESKLFKEIHAPLANLFKKENIDFKFETILK